MTFGRLDPKIAWKSSRLAPESGVFPSSTPGKENGPPCQKLREKLIFWEVEQKLIEIYLLHCNLGVVELIQSGLGKHWVQFSLASDLLIAIQLD